VVAAWPGIGFGHGEDQRRPGVEVPDLGGIDPVPVAARPRLQQKVDAGASGPVGLIRDAVGGDPSFAVVTALGVRDEAKAGNNLVSGHLRTPVWCVLT
jgi:hypothetical protein